LYGTVVPYAGAETTVFESRPYMDRNNVLKLWTFVMEDLKNLGAKKFCPNLGTKDMILLIFLREIILVFFYAHTFLT
jgi:hypothetical protein